MSKNGRSWGYSKEVESNGSGKWLLVTPLMTLSLKLRRGVVSQVLAGSFFKSQRSVAEKDCSHGVAQRSIAHQHGYHVLRSGHRGIG